MYQLNFNGVQLYDPRLEELTIRDPSVHLAVDEAGSLSFTIDHDHPFAGSSPGSRAVWSCWPTDCPSSGDASFRTPRALT